MTSVKFWTFKGAAASSGSVHIEVNDTLTVSRIDAMPRRIVSKVYCEYNVLLTGVGIYSVNFTG